LLEVVSVEVTLGKIRLESGYSQAWSDGGREFQILGLFSEAAGPKCSSNKWNAGLILDNLRERTRS